MIELDKTLLAQARRAPRQDSLSLDKRIALNLFWRLNVRVPVLAHVFHCSKNTIYANCLTGDAASYVSGHRAREVNEIIDRMGINKAYAKYVTDDMVRAINAANKELVERKRTRVLRAA